jgi:acetone carboxylase gamma subunit
MNAFNDRTTYLAYRRNWKLAYKELSQTIRDTKAKMKTAAQPEQGRLQMTREYLRRDARHMLAELVEARVEAQHQWEAERDAKVAA